MNFRVIVCCVAILLLCSSALYLGVEQRWLGAIDLVIWFTGSDQDAPWEVVVLSRETGEQIASASGNADSNPHVVLSSFPITGTDRLFFRGQAHSNLKSLEFRLTCGDRQRTVFGRPIEVDRRAISNEKGFATIDVH